MISFAFTPEQDAFRAELRRFAAARLTPGHLDRAAESTFPWAAHHQDAIETATSMLGRVAAQ